MNSRTPVTSVSLVEDQRVVYQKRHWFIFSWWERVDTTSIGKDLVITTQESYDHVYLNGKEVFRKEAA